MDEGCHWQPSLFGEVIDCTAHRKSLSTSLSTAAHGMHGDKQVTNPHVEQPCATCCCDMRGLTDFFLDICHIFRKLTPLHMTDSNNKL